MIKKILLGILSLFVLFLIISFVYVQNSWNRTYDLPFPELKTSTDSVVIARGKYLVHGPAHCSSCHVSDLLNPATNEDGNILQGGAIFHLGPLGTMQSPNLTPDSDTGIGRYSDGEVFRMMRHAVKPDGTASLSLMMPFWNMADEDLEAVVSYLRSIEPIRNETSQPEWTFIGKIVRTFTPTFEPVYNPTPPEKSPPMEPTIARGEYIARYVANCVGCHTPRDMMTFQAIGPEFSGGMEMEPDPGQNEALGLDPNLWMRTPNLTPYEGSALSKFKTSEQWIARFRQGRVYPSSFMNWEPFSTMTDEDLEALYLFFNSLEPVEKDIGDIAFIKE